MAGKKEADDENNMILMLDTQIYDLIVADDEVTKRISVRVESGELEILSTHVQESELNAIPDPEKRSQVSRIPRVHVPTSDFVLDFSALDGARLGDGALVEAIRDGNINHTKDALIAATAQLEGAILVTEDKTLLRRSEVEKISVWNYAHLHQWLFDS